MYQEMSTAACSASSSSSCTSPRLLNACGLRFPLATSKNKYRMLIAANTYSLWFSVVENDPAKFDVCNINNFILTILKLIDTQSRASFS